jgi:MFS family permease
MLWRHTDFLKLWAGQTMALFGSQIKFLALPLTAILLLDASPAQMGILSAVGSLPALVIGLFIGVWVDRRRRRPLLIAADVGRAALVLIVPAAALAGILRMELLYIVAFGTGAFSLFFSVAYLAYLPTLVGRDHIIEGNSKLEVSRSAAEVAGPGLAGFLTQTLTAPAALIFNALSYLVSALFLAFIRTPEPEPARPESRQTVWQEARAGIRIVIGNPSLRAVAGCTGTLSLFNAVLETVWILYLTRYLAIDPGLLGIIFAGGSVGFLVGALAAERIIRRVGLGYAMIAGLMLATCSDLITPLAGGTPLMVAMLLIIAQFGFGIGSTTFGISQVSLRQTITPDQLQGRMNAVMQVISFGVVPVGALIGGVLGEAVGPRSTLLLGAAGEMLAIIWLLLSPVLLRRQQPAT